MALSYVGRAGSATGNTRGAAVTATTTSSIAAGDLIIVSVSGENVGDLSDLASVTDTAGNTYVSAVHTVDGGQNTLCAVWYCANCLALASGATVTVTFNTQLLASGESWEIAVDDVSGAATSTPTDGTNGHNSQVISSTATWDTNTITTTNAADLLWVAMGVNQGEPAAITNANSTPSSGWTIQTGITGGSNSHNSLRTAYQIVSSTGTYKGGGTATTFSNGVSAVIVAFKAAAGGATTNTRTVPASLATQTTSTHTVPASVVTQTTSTRTVFTSLAAQTTASRTVPASVVASTTASRTVPTSVVAQVAASKTIPTSIATQATTAHTVPTSIAAQTTSSRTVSSSLATQTTSARDVPASVVASVVGTESRTVPTSLVAEATQARTVAASLAAQVTATRTIPTSLVASGTAVASVPGTVTLTDALAATVTLSDTLAATVTLSDALAATVTLSDAPAEAA